MLSKFRFFYAKTRKFFFVGLVVLTILSGFATYAIATLEDLQLRTSLLRYFVYIDIFFVLFFLLILSFKSIEIWGRRRQHSTRLYRQTVFIFACVAIVPSLFVFFVNYVFLNKGIEAWFGRPVKVSLEVSRNIAEAYIQDNQQALEAQTQLIVGRVQQALEFVYGQPNQEHEMYFNGILNEEARLFRFSEAMIVDLDFNVLGRSDLTLGLQFELTPEDLAQVLAKQQAVPYHKNDRMRIIAPIGKFGERFVFLVIGKIVPPQIVRDIEQARSSIAHFKALQIQKSGLQLTVTLIMGILTLLILLIAIWCGFYFSDQLMRPISDLIVTAQKVGQGSWYLRAKSVPQKNELNTLIRTFNMMLDQIYTQHKDLRYAKNLNETIIANITTGIVILDERGGITKINKRAQDILGLARKMKNLHDMSDEFVRIFKERRLNLSNVTIYTAKGYRTLQVSLSELPDNLYILAFDDLTDLLLAEKQASWREIARRIAHEIKNPLTPIQLSAERLKKKYMSEIKTDPEVFQSCVEVIVRQVRSILNLVKQFTSFAKTQVLQLEKIDFVKFCQRLIIFFEGAHAHIKFSFDCKLRTVTLHCDETQIQQAVLNLVNNSVAMLKEHGVDSPTIRFELSEQDGTIRLVVRDNGPGFPRDIMHKLTEPYVTKRKEGSGVGLAVVSKIIEDHGGTLSFSNDNGAVVTIVFKQEDVGHAD